MNKATARTFDTARQYAADGNRGAAGRLISSALRASMTDRNSNALLDAVVGAGLADTIRRRADGCWLAA